MEVATVGGSRGDRACVCFLGGFIDGIDVWKGQISGTIEAIGIDDTGVVDARAIVTKRWRLKLGITLVADWSTILARIKVIIEVQIIIMWGI